MILSVIQLHVAAEILFKRRSYHLECFQVRHKGLRKAAYIWILIQWSEIAIFSWQIVGSTDFWLREQSTEAWGHQVAQEWHLDLDQIQGHWRSKLRLGPLEGRQDVLFIYVIVEATLFFGRWSLNCRSLAKLELRRSERRSNWRWWSEAWTVYLSWNPKVWRWLAEDWTGNLS